MLGVARRAAALVVACVLLASVPATASAHYDPFEAVHTHAAGPVEDDGGGTSPAVVAGVVVLMLASAGALVGVKRAGTG